MRSSASGGGYIQVTAPTCRAEIRAAGEAYWVRTATCSWEMARSRESGGAVQARKFLMGRRQPAGDAHPAETTA